MTQITESSFSSATHRNMSTDGYTQSVGDVKGSASQSHVLYKVLYHNTKHRKLPDVKNLKPAVTISNSGNQQLNYASQIIPASALVPVSDSSPGAIHETGKPEHHHPVSSQLSYKTKLSKESAFKTKTNKPRPINYHKQETFKRSLPILPSTSIQETTTASSNVNQEEKPPSPLVRTNEIYPDDLTVPDYSSTDHSEDETKMDNPPVTIRDRPGSVLQNQSDLTITQNNNFPTVNQLIMTCQIENATIKLPVTTNKITNFLKLHTNLLNLTNLTMIEIPQGKRASNIGLNPQKTAFKIVSTTAGGSNKPETNKHSPSNIVEVTVVKEVSESTNEFSSHNLNCNDILIMIGNEYIGDKSLAEINKLLTRSNHTEIVIGRLSKQNESSDNKKDEQIKQLKEELKSLQKKYSMLHKQTEENNQIIMQLNHLLKNK